MSLQNILNDNHKKDVKLKIEVIGEPDDSLCLIEGNSEALFFLGTLLQEMSKNSGDCGFQISPNGAGSSFFKESTIGLYLHRTPCMHNK